MDMSFDPKEISGLFEMSRDAVLGIDRDSILFLNPAAAALFQAKPGDPAENCIPNYILTVPADQFVASIRIHDRAGYATVSRSGGFVLICVVLPPAENVIPAILTGSVRELSGALMATRLAADVLIKHLDAETDEKVVSHSTILYQNYFRMKRLCDHISKADSLQRGIQHFAPRVVAIDHMCGELCASVNHFLTPSGITLEFEAEPGKYNTLADLSLLETLLLNAIANSIAHLQDVCNGARVRLRLYQRGDRIILAVDDNGSGIPTERLSTVIHSQTPTSLPDAATGAGLGLMIARGIAELHGGALILESREGVGTKLRVSLPIRLPEDPILHTPAVTYNKEGMSTILTELSVILDKKFYNKTMFD